MYGWDLITLFFFLEIIMYLPFTVEQLEVKPPKAPHHPRPPTKKKSWLLFWKWFHTSSYFWFLTARENEAQFSLNQQKLEIMYHSMSVFIYLFMYCLFLPSQFEDCHTLFLDTVQNHPRKKKKFIYMILRRKQFDILVTSHFDDTELLTCQGRSSKLRNSRIH